MQTIFLLQKACCYSVIFVAFAVATANPSPGKNPSSDATCMKLEYLQTGKRRPVPFQNPVHNIANQLYPLHP
jgi:hypothetical protein